MHGPADQQRSEKVLPACSAVADANANSVHCTTVVAAAC